ncbi:MAG TPA: response regulator [Edaphobacter sp.]|nr:response regulator [Edaphobacter sp.]
MILLVDDNAIQATIRRTILERSGYTTITALQPSRALEYLQTEDPSSRIDLVITDHLMPEMKGSAFSREVRLLCPDMPILVISGLEEAIEEYADLPNVEFRVKPLQPERLLACVRQMVGAPEPPATQSPLAIATA